mgnify:CR=1 FL=1
MLLDVLVLPELEDALEDEEEEEDDEDEAARKKASEDDEAKRKAKGKGREDDEPHGKESERVAKLEREIADGTHLPCLFASTEW